MVEDFSTLSGIRMQLIFSTESPGVLRCHCIKYTNVFSFIKLFWVAYATWFSSTSDCL